jgi:hypothetical protein
MIFNALLDTSHNRPLHPFKDAGVAADSLTGIQNVTVNCLFVVNRSCIYKDFLVPPQVKIQRIQIGEHGGHAVDPPLSIHPSAKVGVIENISYNMAKMCQSIIMHVPHSCSDCRWYIFQ